MRSPTKTGQQLESLSPEMKTASILEVQAEYTSRASLMRKAHPCQHHSAGCGLPSQARHEQPCKMPGATPIHWQHQHEEGRHHDKKPGQLVDQKATRHSAHSSHLRKCKPVHVNMKCPCSSTNDPATKSYWQRIPTNADMKRSAMTYICIPQAHSCTI